MSIAEYILQLQSFEEYAFSWDELLKSCNKTETALKRELSRLVASREIVNLRKEFYLIIPARYSRQGIIPVQLYIDKLFKFLKRRYYLGYYSAAKFHGASHQQPQREYVMIEKPKLTDIGKKDMHIRFVTTSYWPAKNIQEKKSDAGIFKISSPVLTAVDLIRHQNKLGGLNRMLAIIEELAEEITAKDISELLTWYPHKSTIQRFGFILSELKVDPNLPRILALYLKNSDYYPVLLAPRSEHKPGGVENFWKVDVNIKLESDI